MILKRRLRVWHKALWSTMRLYNINANLIQVIENLYNKAASAVYLNGDLGDWFRTTVGVTQGCLLSPTLFNIFLERIMTDALEDHQETVSIGGRTTSNLLVADYIDGLTGKEEGLASLVDRLDKTSAAFGMEISAAKTKLMTNNAVSALTSESTVKNWTRLTASSIWAQSSQIRVTSLKHCRARLMRPLVISVLLYACETWTLTADISS